MSHTAASFRAIQFLMAALGTRDRHRQPREAKQSLCKGVRLTLEGHNFSDQGAHRSLGLGETIGRTLKQGE
jgi:hypothetical protein